MPVEAGVLAIIVVDWQHPKYHRSIFRLVDATNDPKATQVIVSALAASKE